MLWGGLRRPMIRGLSDCRRRNKGRIRAYLPARWHRLVILSGLGYHRLVPTAAINFPATGSMVNLGRTREVSDAAIECLIITLGSRHGYR